MGQGQQKHKVNGMIKETPPTKFEQRSKTRKVNQQTNNDNKPRNGDHNETKTWNEHQNHGFTVMGRSPQRHKVDGVMKET